MGWVICPNGMSVKVSPLGDKVIVYEQLIKDIKDEKWKPVYRARCLIAAGEVNLITDELITYLTSLVGQTHNEFLKKAIIAAAKKAGKSLDITREEITSDKMSPRLINVINCLEDKTLKISVLFKHDIPHNQFIACAKIMSSIVGIISLSLLQDQKTISAEINKDCIKTISEVDGVMYVDLDNELPAIDFNKNDYYCKNMCC